MRQAERVARRASGGHGGRRAARPLRARAGRVLPETQRHADRLTPCTVQRDGAVDAAAHRDRDPSGDQLGGEDLAERGGERLDRERLARHAGRLEERQPRERPLEPLGVALDDAVALDGKPDAGPVAVLRRISEDLPRAPAQASALYTCSLGTCSLGTCSTLPMKQRLLRTWLCQVGAVRGVGAARGQHLSPTPAPFS